MNITTTYDEAMVKAMIAEAVAKERNSWSAQLAQLAQPAQHTPVGLRDAVVVNLLREGINKHRARELADHLISLTPPPAQRKPLTVEELKAKWNAQSDHMNQWEELGLDEIVLFAQEGDL